MDRCVILVGHGGIPADCPPALVAEFKRLESAARGRATPELAEADRKLREWPRTPATDPYQAGLEDIAAALEKTLGEPVLPAYNEFCAPSLQDAFAGAAARGARQVTVISTMYTRGGIHSETEIPQILEELRRRHPAVAVRYVWPLDVGRIAAFLAGEIAAAQAPSRK